MKIEVLGSGCATCKKLYELVEQAVQELGLKEKVEYTTNIQKIIELGVLSSPVLTIDGETVLAGYVPNIDKIKDLIDGKR